mmetsp:Transcript_26468/g.76411  ORF Transcript_26468/g.76411 Transcript_26468/m.76411 type:complete len:310 (+) Transcript_26468:782-1711(+)
MPRGIIPGWLPRDRQTRSRLLRRDGSGRMRQRRGAHGRPCLPCQRRGDHVLPEASANLLEKHQTSYSSAGPCHHDHLHANEHHTDDYEGHDKHACFDIDEAADDDQERLCIYDREGEVCNQAPHSCSREVRDEATLDTRARCHNHMEACYGHFDCEGHDEPHSRDYQEAKARVARPRRWQRDHFRLVCVDDQRRGGRSYARPLRQEAEHLRVRVLVRVRRRGLGPHSSDPARWLQLKVGALGILLQHTGVSPRLGCLVQRGKVEVAGLDREGRSRHRLVSAQAEVAPQGYTQLRQVLVAKHRQDDARPH